MAFFELSSEITIGSFCFSGVHEVEIKRSIHSISETATIKLPAKASIIKNSQLVKDDVITGEQFKEGEPVEIRLGYNGKLRTEFKGFVKNRNLDKPLVIECEGSSFRLSKTAVDRFDDIASTQQLLEKATGAVKGDPRISVRCDTELTLEGLRTAHATATALVNNLVTAADGNLTCFFIEPDVLWCGMPYTSLATGRDPFNLGAVSYTLGVNTVSNIKLKLHEGLEKLNVSYSKKVLGKKKTVVSDAYKATNKDYSNLLNQPGEGSLKMLANEMAYRTGYTGYEGSIETFLEPYVAPGFIADISSENYKERDGKYLVEGVQVKFGIGGARRIVDLGPALGFQNKK